MLNELHNEQGRIPKREAENKTEETRQRILGTAFKASLTATAPKGGGFSLSGLEVQITDDYRKDMLII